MRSLEAVQARLKAQRADLVRRLKTDVKKRASVAVPARMRQSISGGRAPATPAAAAGADDGPRELAQHTRINVVVEDPDEAV